MTTPEAVESTPAKLGVVNLNSQRRSPVDALMARSAPYALSSSRRTVPPIEKRPGAITCFSGTNVAHVSRAVTNNKPSTGSNEGGMKFVLPQLSEIGRAHV